MVVGRYRSCELNAESVGVNSLEGGDSGSAVCNCNNAYSGSGCAGYRYRYVSGTVANCCDCAVSGNCGYGFVGGSVGKVGLGALNDGVELLCAA